MSEEVRIFMNGKELERGVTQRLLSPKIKLEEIRELGSTGLIEMCDFGGRYENGKLTSVSIIPRRDNNDTR